MNPFTVLILLPTIAGILLFMVPERFRNVKGILTILVSAIALIIAIQAVSIENGLIQLSITGSVPGLIPDLALIDEYLVFQPRSAGEAGHCIYSHFCPAHRHLQSSIPEKISAIPGIFDEYYLITLGSSFGALLSDHLLVFLFFWGVLGLTLYKLIRGYDDESSSTAKKTLILIGASDSLMILGAALIWLESGTFSMVEISLPTNTLTTNFAFVCMLIGSFTKAGAFPFHSWIPDYAKCAPASSSAYLPASLDKLLGIYFLTRICVNLFVLNQWLILTILIIGVTTIIAAVMMALVQHNYKRLLGYHAVSQVGYMIVGIGLGSPIGIAGGLFHMINNALYKRAFS
jgi:formate hydrogenlyase subunit 3/multisubunit Na+/H+ antiporter MnhD subunit